MAQTSGASRSRRPAGQVLELDRLRATWLSVHAAIILYVGIGWLLPWRAALFTYLILLPLIVFQWLLNGGVSVINNFENVLRSGRWSDPGNAFEGAFFSTFLKAVGIHLSEVQVTTLLCFVMLMFWVAAFSRLMLMTVTGSA